MTARNGRERAELADANCLRVETVIDLAALVALDCVNTDAWEELVDDLVDSDTVVHPSCEPIAEQVRLLFDNDYGDDADEMAYALRENGLMGYAVEFATPVRKYDPQLSGCSYSWGYYNTHWVYAESIDAAWDLGVAWAQERDAEDRRRATNTTE